MTIQFQSTQICLKSLVTKRESANILASKSIECMNSKWRIQFENNEIDLSAQNYPIITKMLSFAILFSAIKNIVTDSSSSKILTILQLNWL